MEPRATVGTDAADARYARESLAAWLRSGRTKRQLTLEDVAKITKIQPRILEKLESGQLEGLPADVFVKGFVRSFAKCVGLDEIEALDRYGACQLSSGNPVAKALVESMGLAAARKAEAVAKAKGQPTKLVDDPAPIVEAPAAIAPVIETAPAIDMTPSSVELAPALEANVEIPAIVEVAAPSEIAPSAEIVAVAVDQPEAPKKKRAPRKKNPNATPRSRKKKATQPPADVEAAPSDAPAVDANAHVDANARIDASHASAQVDSSAHVDEDAQTTQIERIALDCVVEAMPGPIETGPVARTDAESFDVTSIEAKTDATETSDARPDGFRSIAGPNEVRIGDSAAGGSPSRGLGIVDGAVSELALAEGSDRMRASEIASAANESAGSPNSGSWHPTMPPIATTPSAPWRRPHISTSAAPAYVVPTLVIDDADPDSADRERDGRDQKEHRISFLPPILLDREDRSARQGGLTLAVIILLIAATLTLSYLMRRPSPSGDGVTMIDGQSALLS